MKKILLSLMMLLFVSLAYSQKAKFGLKVGVALPKDVGSDITSDTTMSAIFSALDYKPTITGGFYINSEVSDYFWLKHEVNYVNRAYAYSDSGTSLRTNQHYIDVYPLNAAFHFKGGQLFAGPSVSFLAVQTYERINSSGQKVVEKTDLEEANRNIAEIGLVAGVEYEFPFGLNLGARYVRGLTSQYRPEEGQPTVKIYSQALLFTLGFTFGANKKASEVGFD